MCPARRRRSRTRGVILALVAAAAVAAAAYVAAPRLTGSTSGTAGTGTAAPTTSAQAEGRTSVVPAATSSPPYTIKPEPTKVATDSPQSRSVGQADVSITYATYDKAGHAVQASGFVAGIIEDGGVCTLTLTKGTDVVTATSTATADATTTSCGLLQTSGTLSAGTWSAVLSYSSSKAEGRSRALQVAVS